MRSVRWRLLPLLLLAIGVAVWSARREDGGREAEPAAPGAPVNAAAPSRPAEREAPPREVGPHAGPAWMWGSRFLEDAVCWTEGEAPAIDRIVTFHVRLLAWWDDGALPDGDVSCWFAYPDAFRYEVERDIDIATWWVVGDQGWTVGPDGRTEDLAATPKGRHRMAALRVRRDDLLDAVTCITLRPLQSELEDVRFEGYKRGSGAYAGHWIKVAGPAGADRRTQLWLAYEVPEPDEVRATWPGIVRFGDPDADPFAVDWILKDWYTLPERGRSCPRRIEGRAVRRRSGGGLLPERFLFASVYALDVNPHLDGDLFVRPEKPDAR